MISVVTAYYNRKKLFYRTLRSMTASVYKDFEVIAVDDASREEERIEHLMNEFPFLKVIRVDPQDKWYMNSCMPFNMGIAKAKGDIVILQNPECMYVHDVFDYVIKNLTEHKYLTMSCYTIDQEHTDKILPFVNLEYILMLPQQPARLYMGWYNHSVWNPSYFHFCSALTKSNMNKLGGFDERFAEGISYEDNEFLDRVKRLNLEIMIEDKISVIHQWHPMVHNLQAATRLSELYNMNACLHHSTKCEDIVHVVNSYI